MIPLTEDNNMLGYELFRSYPGVFHFVTTRAGGCSRENYASFNCSPFSGDDPEKVRHNRDILLASFLGTGGELIVPYQTHGTEVRVIDELFIRATAEERANMLYGVDALTGNCAGHCLCVSTADCIPVLLFDKRNNAVAAIHAGWRGTVSRIVSRTMKVMKEHFGTSGEDVIACIGPGISLESFEVGDEVYETFRDSGFDMPRISMRNPDTGKWHIDLPEANRLQLAETGVPSAQIELSGICTYASHEQFFSARRLGIRSGRMLSGIMLLP